MNRKTIRWRLPVSYATVALVAALSLGSIMLLVLNGYYSRQEREYLRANAQVFQLTVDDMLAKNTDYSLIQDTLSGLSFLSQTRIFVLDAQGNTIADSGVPLDSQAVTITTSKIDDDVSLSVASNVGIMSGDVETFFSSVNVSADGSESPTYAEAYFIMNASPLGYEAESVSSAVAYATSTMPSRRSSQVVELSLDHDLGKIIVSDGPAYGLEIIRSVTWAWAGASLAAVFVALLAGWIASREVTYPLSELTSATQKMESGDLSVRVDLTEKRQADEFLTLAHSFNNMAHRMEDTISTLRAFAADAAHELHTPLTALNTNLELAEDEPDQNKRIKFLEEAHEQSLRMENLANSLLDLSRIEGSGSLMAKESVDLNLLLAQVIEQYGSCADKEQKIFKKVIPDEVIAVTANGIQLRQALNNLVENALKFTLPGGTVTLTLEKMNGEAILSVSDTGIGIPSEDLPYMFKRFHRGRNVSRYPGNGLGLAIVDALVKAQNGHLTVVSVLGSGTTFKIFLPGLVMGEFRQS